MDLSKDNASDITRIQSQELSLLPGLYRLMTWTKHGGENRQIIKHSGEMFTWSVIYLRYLSHFTDFILLSNIENV